jgi:GNAT superfamily N-acetyltransferase
MNALEYTMAFPFLQIANVILHDLSAYYKQQLIGIGRLVSDGVLYAMIYDMIVDPSFQNRGIGTIILEKLVGRCKARGIRDIQLFSAAGRSSFYAKRGFIKRPANSPGMKYNDR